MSRPRKTDDGDWVTIHTTSIPITHYVDGTVIAGHAYTYRVQALALDDGLLTSDFTAMTYSVTI